MRHLLVAQLPLAVFMLGCSAETSSPSNVETTQLARTAQPQGTFGALSGISVARAASEDGFPCGLGPAGITFDSRITFASSGNATLVCRLRTATGPKPSLVVKGEPCVVGGVVTTDMHFTWAPSGRATLVCHAKH
jgi:hypothetical protein